jgi:hypothetical protein
MYAAMNILGFKTYHFAEAVLAKGLPHLRFFNEALIGQYNRMSGVKRYTKADFDKWMAEYDVSRNLPSSFRQRDHMTEHV